MEYGQAFFWFTALIKLADVVTVGVIWYLAWSLRFESALIPTPKGIPDFSIYAQSFVPLCISFSLSFHLIGAYRRERILFGFRALKKIVQGSIVGSLVFVATLYFMGQIHVSRVYILTFTVLTVFGMVFERGFFHLVWKSVFLSKVRQLRVLLIGSGDLLRMYVARIRSRNPYPIFWVGRVGPPEQTGIENIPYLGEENSLKRVLSARGVDIAVVSFPTEESPRYAPILELLSHELVTVKVLPDFGRYSTFTYQAEHEVGVPLLIFNHVPLGFTDRALKRTVDILVSGLFLILAAPLYCLLAILSKLESKGPIFYSQVRLGADGRLFKIYKFRSMRVDAEAKTGAIFASQNDPRVTPLGRFLRHTSLDEIPQFYNVLKGDMSLVGPRPERPVFVEQFRKEIPKYMLRHKIKSGITGWAQVSGWRGNTSIDERIKCDLYYIENWSHYFDIKILFLTLFRGFVHRHAY